MILMLAYAILMVFFLLFAWNRYKAYTAKYAIKERKDKIKADNVLAKDIQDFREEYDTSDKTDRINNFIKGE